MENVSIMLKIYKLCSEVSKMGKLFPNGLFGNNVKYSPLDLGGNKAVCCYEAEMLKDPENLLRKVMLITKEKTEQLCARNVRNFETCFYLLAV